MINMLKKKENKPGEKADFSSGKNAWTLTGLASKYHAEVGYVVSVLEPQISVDHWR